MKYSEAKQILEQQEKAKAVLDAYTKVASAHEQFGFKTRREFIKVLQEIDQGPRKKGGARGAKGTRGPRGLSADVIDRIKKLKGEGKTNAEISRTVGVSPLTVAKYVKGVAGTAKPARAPRAAPKKGSRAGAKKARRGRAKKK